MKIWNATADSWPGIFIDCGARVAYCQMDVCYQGTLLAVEGNKPNPVHIEGEPIPVIAGGQAKFRIEPR